MYPQKKKSVLKEFNESKNSVNIARVTEVYLLIINHSKNI